VDGKSHREDIGRLRSEGAAFQAGTMKIKAGYNKKLSGDDDIV
jgi:hypothetical protein